MVPNKDLIVEGLQLAIERVEHALESLKWMESSKAIQDVLDCGQSQQLHVRLGLESSIIILDRHLDSLREEVEWWEAYDVESEENTQKIHH